MADNFALDDQFSDEETEASGGSYQDWSHFQFLWRVRAQGAVEDLDADDQALLRAMEMHPELYPLWDRLGFVRPLVGEIVIDDVNPILHVFMDMLVSRQLEQADPPEVGEAVAALQLAGYSRGRALHIVAELFSGHVWEALRGRQAFDRAAYARRLRALARMAAQAGPVAGRPGRDAMGKGRERRWAAGRNDPCPCGSGLKFKRCCGLEPLPELRPESGLFVLNGGAPYITQGYLQAAEQDDVPLRLHNMSAVAAALAGHLRDPEGAWRTYRRMLKVAQRDKDPERRAALVTNVLEEMVEFGLAHPRFAGRAAEAASRGALLHAGDDREVQWTWELDEAELRSMAGQNQEAEAIFRRVVAQAPPDAFVVHSRWAGWLARQGRTGEARAVLERLLEEPALRAEERREIRERLRELGGEEGRTKG